MAILLSENTWVWQWKKTLCYFLSNLSALKAMRARLSFMIVRRRNGITPMHRIAGQFIIRPRGLAAMGGNEVGIRVCSALEAGFDAVRQKNTAQMKTPGAMAGSGRGGT